MKRHIITLAVSCVMLNSCGIYTKYKPASEVSADLYGSEATAQTDTVSLGDMSWREVFTDPQLQTLIEHGLAVAPRVGAWIETFVKRKLFHKRYTYVMKYIFYGT